LVGQFENCWSISDKGFVKEGFDNLVMCHAAPIFPSWFA